MEYICTSCGKKTAVDTLSLRCECSGLFELPNDFPAWDPALIDQNEWSLFRYRAFMHVDGESWRGVTMGEGRTPIIDFDSRVKVKMDYMMPTLSFKDRGAATLVAHMKAIGVRSCVQDSSGNAGNSVAAYCARSGINCRIFVPEGTSPNKIAMIEAFGGEAVVVPGSRDHCADECRRQVFENGAYYANHVFNPYFYEGTKTYVFEILEQLGRIPEHLFIELGNGTLFIGAVKALEWLAAWGAIDRFPTVVAVQGERCAPFAATVETGAEELLSITPEPTMAEGIAIGRPARTAEILDMIRRHNIPVVTAPEDRILDCRSRLAHRGIYIEHTTAAALAAYDHYCEAHGPVDDALLSMCGAGMKSDH